MPSPDEIRAAIESYVKLLCAGDADGILSLYADHPSVEDPVGRDPVVGRDAVRAFYAAAAGRVRVQLTGPIRVAGREAAFPMLAHVDFGERQVEMDVIDVMAFEDDGRIASMRAFWSPAEMRPAPR